MTLEITTIGDCEHGMNKEIKLFLNVLNYKDIPVIMEFCETYFEHRPSYKFSFKED